MPDPKQPPQPESSPEASSNPDEAEKAFWDKHKANTLGILDEWFEKKKTEFSERGTSRTGSGRATLPGILADIMFGPPKR